MTSVINQIPCLSVCFFPPFHKLYWLCVCTLLPVVPLKQFITFTLKWKHLIYGFIVITYAAGPTNISYESCIHKSNLQSALLSPNKIHSWKITSWFLQNKSHFSQQCIQQSTGPKHAYCTCTHAEVISDLLEKLLWCVSMWLKFYPRWYS